MIMAAMTISKNKFRLAWGDALIIVTSPAAISLVYRCSNGVRHRF